MIESFAVADGTLCDTLAGSGALVIAAAAAEMEATGIARNPVDATAPSARPTFGATLAVLHHQAGMDFAASLTRSLQADMQAELREIERAVASGTRDAGRGLKAELRGQVTSAGLGQRLANSWRDRHYPNQKLDAASLVYTKAPQIIRAFDEGAVIRSRRGRFLAIPTENAPRKGTDGRRIRPSTFPEHRFGPLRFVPRPNGPSLLVVDGLRASFGRKSGELRGFRRTTDRVRERGEGLTTVVMFLLVPQVKLSKRLDVARAAERWSAQLPALIEQQLEME